MAWQKYTIKDELECIRLYRGGFSMAEVSRRTGVCTTSIRLMLDRNGIPRRRRKGIPAKHRVNGSQGPHAGRLLTEKHRRLLEYLYVEKRMTQTEIGELLGMTRSGVYGRLVKLGIKRRPNGPMPGRARGSYNLDHLPECATQGCSTRLKGEGPHCYECTRRAGRRERLAAAA